MNKKLISPYLFAFCLSGLACSMASATTTLLSENFPTGERLTQDLPQTAAWYGTFGSGISDTTGNLTSDAQRYALAYFTDSGTINLAEGESIGFNFSVSVTDPASNNSALRIGILNSGGERISADGAGLANTIFNGYTGYCTGLSINSDNAASVYERVPGLDPASNSLISSISDCYETLGSKIGSGATFGNGTFYDVSLTLTHTDAGMVISVTMIDFTGYSATVTDTTDITSAFDTFVIYGTPAGMSSFSMSDIEITYNQIPEPSASMFSLLALPLLALGAVRAIRRRRS
ncbi:MAG: hypothetical protein Q7Q73_03540 [Verrucomicrobiota bacterium JB024]|nr:hypothetical protein [Verrucomicrobiota bacterium JB024]